MGCSRVTLNSVTVGGLIKELHFYNCTPNEGDHESWCSSTFVKTTCHCCIKDNLWLHVASSWTSKLDKDARAPGAVRQQSQHATDIVTHTGIRSCSQNHSFKV